MNCAILVFFMSETVLRVALHRGGWLSYLSNPCNVLDLLVMPANVVFEVVSYLQYTDCSEVAAIIAVIRVVCSLRTINVLNRLSIEDEALTNTRLHSTLLALGHMCSLRESENRRLSKEILVRRKLTKAAQAEMVAIGTNVMSVQRRRWQQLVPSSFSLSFARRSVRSRRPKPRRR